MPYQNLPNGACLPIGDILAVLIWLTNEPNNVSEWEDESTRHKTKYLNKPESQMYNKVADVIKDMNATEDPAKKGKVLEL